MPTPRDPHRPAHCWLDLVAWLGALELRGLSQRTIDDYERTIVALLEFHDVEKLKHYTTGDLEEFILTVYGATTGARTRIAHLNSFFRWLHTRGRIKRNPAAAIEAPRRQSQKVVAVFSEEELARMYVVEPLTVLLCETGLRKSEARNLRRRHVNLDTGELTVYEGKGGKDRVIPLTSRVRQLVSAMDSAGLHSDDFFWPTRPGGGRLLRRDRALSDTAMHRWWAASADDPVPGVLARAMVPYRNLHVTRHTFATRLIRRGATLETVKHLMGHSSIQTTSDIYSHLTTNDVRDSMQLLEDWS